MFSPKFSGELSSSKSCGEPTKAAALTVTKHEIIREEQIMRKHGQHDGSKLTSVVIDQQIAELKWERRWQYEFDELLPQVEPTVWLQAPHFDSWR